MPLDPRELPEDSGAPILYGCFMFVLLVVVGVVAFVAVTVYLWLS